MRRTESHRIGLWVRSLTFFVTMVVSIVPYSLLAIVAYVLPPKPRLRVIGSWAHLVVGLLRILCRIDFRVEHEEALPNGPAVVLSKHQSAWETIAFQLIFPPQSWVLKRELLWIPFFGWGLAAARPISIDRSAGVRALDELVRQGKERLKEGLWVIVFPEGTRTAPGTRGRYNAGGAALAVRAGVPVVPVAHNAGTLWPRRGFLKHPGTIHVKVGRALDTEDKRAREISRAAEAWIEETMQNLPS